METEAFGEALAEVAEVDRSEEAKKLASILSKRTLELGEESGGEGETSPAKTGDGQEQVQPVPFAPSVGGSQVQDVPGLGSEVEVGKKKDFVPPVEAEMEKFPIVKREDQHSFKDSKHGTEKMDEKRENAIQEPKKPKDPKGSRRSDVSMKRPAAKAKAKAKANTKKTPAEPVVPSPKTSGASAEKISSCSEADGDEEISPKKNLDKEFQRKLLTLPSVRPRSNRGRKTRGRGMFRKVARERGRRVKTGRKERKEGKERWERLKNQRRTR